MRYPNALARIARTAILCFSLLCVSSTLVSAWQEGGVPVCRDRGDQRELSIIPDGIGGAVLAWKDPGISCAGVTVYLQRVDSLGNLWWPENVQVSSTIASYESEAGLLLDDSNCAVVVWRSDFDAGADICAQRIDPSGTRLWGPDGIVVDTDTDVDSDSPALVTDGEGGSILVWRSERTDYADIYAARVDSGGSILWGPTCLHEPDDLIYQGFANDRDVIPDGEGGAIVKWWTWNAHFIQRIDHFGDLQWAPAATGKELSIPSPSYETGLVSDGEHGAIVVWSELEGIEEEYFGIYAQHVDSSGAETWPSGGVLVQSGIPADDEYDFSFASDDADGVICSWRRQEVCGASIWAQRLTSSGVTVWGSGRPACTAVGDRSVPAIVPDGSGGAILGWLDTRDWATMDLFGQRLNSSGDVVWCQDGCLLHANTYAQEGAEGGIVTDGNGGVIVFWSDYRNGSLNGDLFVQRAMGSGCAAMDEPGKKQAEALLKQNYPNPFRESTRISFTLNRSGRVAVRIYGVGGEVVRTLIDEFRGPGEHSISWDGRTSSGRKAAPGLYLCELEASTTRLARKVILLQ